MLRTYVQINWEMSCGRWRKKNQHAEPDRLRHKAAAGIHSFMYNREDTQTPDEQRTRTKEKGKKGKKYFWSEIKQHPREKNNDMTLLLVYRWKGHPSLYLFSFRKGRERKEKQNKTTSNRNTSQRQTTTIWSITFHNITRTWKMLLMRVSRSSNLKEMSRRGKRTNHFFERRITRK